MGECLLKLCFHAEKGFEVNILTLDIYLTLRYTWPHGTPNPAPHCDSFIVSDNIMKIISTEIDQMLLFQEKALVSVGIVSIILPDLTNTPKMHILWPFTYSGYVCAIVKSAVWKKKLIFVHVVINVCVFVSIKTI